MAVYRARETERPDAAFRDPYARALAGERVRLDLSNGDARRGLFERLGASAPRAAILSEGLLIYLMRDEAASLAYDLARQRSFEFWVVDLVSPGLMEMLRERSGDRMREAGAPFLFAPHEGAAFFTSLGWTAVEVKSILKAAGKLGRLPIGLRLLSLLPESSAPAGSRPWSGVVLLSRRN